MSDIGRPDPLEPEIDVIPTVDPVPSPLEPPPALEPSPPDSGPVSS